MLQKDNHELLMTYWAERLTDSWPELYFRVRSDQYYDGYVMLYEVWFGDEILVEHSHELPKRFDMMDFSFQEYMNFNDTFRDMKEECINEAVGLVSQCIKALEKHSRKHNPFDL